jgi:A/G-specific adenine glycosylase
LHAAARAIVERFSGRIPTKVEDLMTLPGVGRYTAGAIASIAFGGAAPIVDGNVLRVLLRVRGKDLDPGDKTTAAWAWRGSEGLVNAADDPGRFNEGIMELGATVCLPPPAAPLCPVCPWRGSCRALATGRTGQIPRPKKLREPRVLFAAALVLTRPRDGAILMERRGEAGMWAGMWQAPTIERDDRPATAAEVGELMTAACDQAQIPRKIAEFVHQTTHRMLRFTVWRATLAGRAPGGRRWVLPDELPTLALSNAARRVLLLGIEPDEAGRSERLTEKKIRRGRR